MFLATPSMHGIAAITGNMHHSRYFVLLERITSNMEFHKMPHPVISTKSAPGQYSPAECKPYLAIKHIVFFMASSYCASSDIKSLFCAIRAHH